MCHDDPSEQGLIIFFSSSFSFFFSFSFFARIQLSFFFLLFVFVLYVALKKRTSSKTGAFCLVFAQLKSVLFGLFTVYDFVPPPLRCFVGNAAHSALTQCIKCGRSMNKVQRKDQLSGVVGGEGGRKGVRVGWSKKKKKL